MLTLEHLDHLVGGDAAGEGYRQHRARREPDVEIEIGDLPVDEEVVEGLETTDLEGSARNGSARKDQRHLRLPPGAGTVTLANQCQSHGIPLSAHRRMYEIHCWSKTESAP